MIFLLKQNTTNVVARRNNNMKQLAQLASIAALILVASFSEARNIRATDLDSKEWSHFFAGEYNDWIIEFRQGDEIPVSLTAEGDFFETNQIHSTPLYIKKNFWLKINDKKGVLASLDGTNFQPLPQFATGTLTVGAGSQNGVANGINMNIKAIQK
jgi:hypothetical protein